MPSRGECAERVSACLTAFLRSAGHGETSFDESTDLARELGLTSLEGVDFVLDLCETFKFDFPEDFNPVVHESGKRGMRYGELIDRVAAYLEEEESS